MTKSDQSSLVLFAASSWTCSAGLRIARANERSAERSPWRMSHNEHLCLQPFLAPFLEQRMRSILQSALSSAFHRLKVV